MEMKRLTAGFSGAEVVSLPVKYPQGAEKQLIYAITGRTVPSGKLPMEVGCVVQNVGTALAVSEAVEKGKPMIERVLTITGDGIKEPLNVKARIGALYQDVAEFAGGLTGIPKKIISGGPMMGIAQPNLALPVIKGTSGILVLKDILTEVFEEDPCINCGKCVEVCPMNLLPTTIAQYVEYEKYDMAGEFNAMDCIECGSCSYICPSHRYLVQYIRRGKAEIIKRRKKAS
jgi:electron transport complex protein RnfC